MTLDSNRPRPERSAPDEIDAARPEMRAALARLLLQTSTDACPSTETLIDWAAGTLDASLLAKMKAHLPECPICADAAIALQSAFLPLRSLQQGWGGWRGPILAASGRLDPTTARAWREHCARQEPSRRRTEWAGAALGLFKPALTFASGGLCACVLLLLIWVRPFSALPVEPIKPFVEYTNLKSAEREATNNPARDLIEQATEPNDGQLPAAIQIWEAVAAAHPESPTPWSALTRLYTRRAHQEQDPKHRQVWQDKAHKAQSSALHVLTQTQTRH